MRDSAPRVTYAVPDAVADHRDLLLSTPALDRTKEGGRVPLTFRHALAAVVFEASVDGTLSEGQSIRITGIRLGKFLHKATCHHELPDAITQTLATDAADREYALSEADGTLQGNSLGCRLSRLPAGLLRNGLRDALAATDR